MDKEKQIEEMAKDVWKASCAGRDTPCHMCKFSDMKKDSYSCLDYIIAEGLYNTGYRKQSEGEWIFGKLGGQGAWVCSLCGAGFTGENAEWIAKEHIYCPKCGSKMKGGAE